MRGKQEKFYWGRRVRWILQEIAVGYSYHKLPTLAAAIAYRGLFSAIPLAAIIAASYTPLQQLFNAMPTTPSLQKIELAWLVEAGIQETAIWQQAIDQPIVQLVGLGLLLYGASSAFSELSAALLTIFEVKARGKWRGFIWRRLMAMGIVVGLTVLLGAAVFSQWLVGIVESFVGDYFALGVASSLWQWLLVPLTALAFLTSIYRLVPQTTYTVRDIFPGATLTAILFWIGQEIMGWWLEQANLASVTGIAGSVTIFLLWCYYTSLLILIGAEWIRAQKRG